jgi:hypothetical protein
MKTLNPRRLTPVVEVFCFLGKLIRFLFGFVGSRCPMSTRPRWACAIVTLVRVLSMSKAIVAAPPAVLVAALVLTPMPASVRNAVGGAAACGLVAALVLTPLPASVRNAVGGAACRLSQLRAWTSQNITKTSPKKQRKKDAYRTQKGHT